MNNTQLIKQGVVGIIALITFKSVINFIYKVFNFIWQLTLIPYVINRLGYIWNKS